MAARFLTTIAVAILAAVTASSAVSSLRPNRLRPSTVPGSMRLYASGSRSAEQRRSATAGKYDAALADLSRHAALASSSHALADLHSLSPAARFIQTSASSTALVLIDAVTRGDPQQLKAALVGLGLQRASVYANDVGGWLPVTQLEAATARAEVHSIRAAMPRARSGAVTSQGDYAQRSDVIRSTYTTLTGTGVTVGVLSDSYNCYAVYAADGVSALGTAGYASNGFLATAATDVSTSDLPSSVNVLKDATCMNYGSPTYLPFADEGRAMLQIVHDVAPGASLAFYTAENSEADFANGIAALAAAGATVIADDVGYFDEPFYQDGIVAQAIDAVEAKGVAYFSAAGNDGNTSYENLAPSFATLSNSAPTAGEYLLNFDTSGATTTTALPVYIDTLVPGQFAAIVVEWDQPYVTGAASSGGATSRIDVCVTSASGTDTITDYDGNTVSCTGANALGVDPVQIMIIGNPASASGNTVAETVNVTVGLADGTTAPGRIKVTVETDGQYAAPITTFATNSSTVQGHPGAVGAAAVGAAFFFDTPRCGTSPAALEYYSSQGGGPILFDSSGTRLTTAITRQKPDFVGPDGGNDTFLGFTLASGGYTGSNGELSTNIASCQNNPSYPNFFGTSAATPHAAGIAALMLQANSAATPTQIYDALRNSALAMDGSAPNYNSGYGFIQADAALALIPPAAPTLSLAATSVSAGSSTTITWSSVNTTSCTASGSWSGALAVSGTQTITPAAAGTDTYALTCTNAAGTSTSTSVSLTVTAKASSSGGGALGGLVLWGLAGLGGARLVVLRARRRPT
ncbi:MAG TPA: S8 family serine peptidase [Steroidobacteraceae bacterium]|nr:S8 family serine peptidase [Steroidobacteraceae bacterium]